MLSFSISRAREIQNLNIIYKFENNLVGKKVYIEQMSLRYLKGKILQQEFSTLSVKKYHRLFQFKFFVKSVMERRISIFFLILSFSCNSDQNSSLNQLNFAVSEKNNSNGGFDFCILNGSSVIWAQCS